MPKMLYHIVAFVRDLDLCIIGTEDGAGLAVLFQNDSPHPQRKTIKPLIERYVNISRSVPSLVVLPTCDT